MSTKYLFLKFRFEGPVGKGVGGRDCWFPPNSCAEVTVIRLLRVINIHAVEYRAVTSVQNQRCLPGSDAV